MSPAVPLLPIQVAARLLARGQASEAVGCLEKMTREAPTYAAAVVLLASAHEAAGSPEAALDAWDRAAALVPNSPLVFRERGRLMAVLQGTGAESAPEADILPPEDPDSAGWSVSPEAAVAVHEGWTLLSEEDVPTPPRYPEVEPDVIAPERDRPAGGDGRRLGDELDDLIDRIEGAPRIRPDPSYVGPAEPLDAGDLTTVYSETLAEIYASQGQYGAAAEVYDTLARQRPDDATGLRRKAAECRRAGGQA